MSWFSYNPCFVTLASQKDTKSLDDSSDEGREIYIKRNGPEDSDNENEEA